MLSKNFKFLLLFIISLISFFHLYSIDTLPRGLWVDESSIGLNAALISKTLKDEHGYFMPLYFRAFGEYKNPVYIYFASITFKIFGISVLNLRITSFIFYLIAFASSSYLMYRLFNKNKLILLYFIVSLGFLPVYFHLSRISFEVISQLAGICLFLTSLYLLNLYEKYRTHLSLLSGILLGISLYTYTTSKLYVFLFLILTIYVFRNLFFKDIKLLKLYLLGFIVLTIPLIIGIFLKPEMLFTKDFQKKTKIGAYSVPVSTRISAFTFDYLKVFSPDYLIINGSYRPMQSLPNSAVIFKINYFLFFIGLYFYLKKGVSDYLINSFGKVFLIALLISAIGGPLTGQYYHLYRNFLMGIFILFFSCFALYYINQISSPAKSYIYISIFTLLIVEVVFFQYGYFTKYKELSTDQFESYGFIESFYAAKSQNPNKIVLTNKTEQPYVHFKFYDQIQNLDENIKVEIGEPLPEVGTCLLFIPGNKPRLDMNSINYEFYDIKEPDWFYSVRCFKSLKSL